MKRFLVSLGLAVAATAASAAYPDKPIKLVVPSAPGGSVDKLARAIGRKLEQRLGQPVIVDNRAGAGGTIATEAAAKAPADGYTLLIGTVAGLATNVSLEKLRYDPLKDLAPIMLVGLQDFVLCVNNDVPAKSVKELVALAAKQPNAIAFASAGKGTGSHLSGELLGQLTNVKLLHVPYKGMAQATTDLIGGQVPMTFASTASALPVIQGKKVRPLAVSGLKRSALLPELPTLNEAGVKGYESSTWYGIVAPAATPQPVLQKLHTEIVGILKDPELKNVFAEEGIELVGNTPQQFKAFMAKEIDKWRKVVKSAGIEGS